MAKVSEIVNIFVFISLWHTISGQNSCLNNPCLCCKNNKCETHNNNRCTDGCVDGFWGSSCYNECPTHCDTCTRVSIDSGYPCTTCIAGKYGFDCNDNCRSECVSCTNLNKCDKCIDGRYGTLCRSKCITRCVSCTSYYNCDECVDGRYGTACQSYCRSECLSCKNYDNCDECVDGRYGTSCEGFCPIECLICTSNIDCSKCIAGRYGSTCMDNCSTLCKDSLCNMDGSCIACPDGYYGSFCQFECPGKCITCVSLNNCTTCTLGLFGPLCNETCPENCIDCTSSTTCQACKPGLKGSYCQDKCTNCKPGTLCDKNSGRCDTCIDGKYWDDCTFNCHTGCLSCDRNIGDKCTECKAGKYGYVPFLHCNYNCPNNNCLDSKCDANTGNCLECQQGFNGKYCRCPVNCQTCDTYGNCQLCIDGYGNRDKQCECKKDKCLSSGCDQCNDTTWYPDVNSQSCCQCSINCKGGQCVSDTECATGCEDGYYGNACDKLCFSRDKKCLQCTAYGNDKDHKCSKCSHGFYPDIRRCQVCYSNCKNNNCDQSSGLCVDGCKIGFWGETCESSCFENCLTCNQVTGECEVCKDGKFNSNCSISCSEKCMVSVGEELKCRINDGACLDGCVSTKLYGLQCNENCSSNCKDGECDWQKGNCLTCVANKYGPICGDECSNNCVTNAQDSQLTRCYGENGTCSVGCINGFYGYKCEYSCSQYCSNTTCGRLNGECLHGCMDGYTGGICTQALVNSEPVAKSGFGATIGGAVGGIIVVVLIAIAVVLLVRKRRGSNSKNPSTHSNDEIQNKPKDMSDPVHSYYNTNESAPETETTHEYEELDVVPQNMQRSGLSADHHGYSDVIETGDVNTYEPLNRPEINTDVYSQLKHSAYENTTI